MFFKEKAILCAKEMLAVKYMVSLLPTASLQFLAHPSSKKHLSHLAP